MSEMEDRVAAAIVRQYREYEDVGDGREIARAVFKAMREPTEAMLDAACDWSTDEYGKAIGDAAAVGCWQAMIDAALGR